MNQPVAQDLEEYLVLIGVGARGEPGSGAPLRLAHTVCGRAGGLRPPRVRPCPVMQQRGGGGTERLWPHLSTGEHSALPKMYVWVELKG